MAEELSDFIEASGLLEYDPEAIDSIYKKNPIRLLRRLWQTLLPIGLFLIGVGTVTRITSHNGAIFSTEFERFHPAVPYGGIVESNS